MIEPPSDGDNTFGNHVIVVRNSDDETANNVHFVAKVRTPDSTRYFLLRLDIKSDGGNSASVETVKRVDDLFSIMPVMDALPYTAIRVRDRVFLTVAEHGCGYMWHVSSILCFNLQMSNVEAIEVRKAIS